MTPANESEHNMASTATDAKPLHIRSGNLEMRLAESPDEIAATERLSSNESTDNSYLSCSYGTPSALAVGPRIRVMITASRTAPVESR